MRSDSSFIFWIIALAVSLFSLYAMYCVTLIKAETEKQTKILEDHTNKMEQHSIIMIAQMELIASIADKAGVPMDDINEVTKDFGVTFTE